MAKLQFLRYAHKNAPVVAARIVRLGDGRSSE
jgi:hypothetical protein